MTGRRTASLSTAAIAIVLTAPGMGQTPSLQQTNDDLVRRVAATIVGREHEPASQVFKNVQFLKNTEAGTLLAIMNGGYARALGVACAHCHNENDFASDEKRPKRAAREMQVMHRGINDQLRVMQNLSSQADRRAINCSACHRGEITPFRG